MESEIPFFQFPPIGRGRPKLGAESHLEGVADTLLHLLLLMDDMGDLDGLNSIAIQSIDHVIWLPQDGSEDQILGGKSR
ncbi:unnamed protein product [Clonostachys chloroleuca]|uniref:Uncharacterized protein n=1 Tax=Clonostachys chloroleuca TaxID=1926264 RepID=A0AA35M555_9HYPO|nr:unnamed protein product [Clonostachys chloroleuca]